jgi:hypothetical protein
MSGWIHWDWLFILKAWSCEPGGLQPWGVLHEGDRWLVQRKGGMVKRLLGLEGVEGRNYGMVCLSVSTAE